MLPKKIINSRVQEQKQREFTLGKLERFGVVDVKIEKTPLGIKVVALTPKPGILITRASQLMHDIVKQMSIEYNQEISRIEVEQVKDPILDPAVVADSISFKINKYGPMRYKAIVHQIMEDVLRGGAGGVEIELSGVIKERAARFKFRPHGSVMPKTGQIELFGVRKAKKQLVLKRGTIGIKVTIVVPPEHLGGIKLKDGRGSEGAGDGAPKNERKEDAGTAAS